ncbi:MAG TPA: O-antigen ligase family protein [Phycisphaerae bacterium]|nr:O-antigen ligase family protein [Phycisphaerae bacterium]HON65073.1 O-antigen ligase family protein [Phycisphaerae bacterium]HOQ84080.1 O-antigen ligase family protein [Phycisphaerae bacterium]HPU24792.1 O-antigen ligase family protein [Phycisphaerae bacterium]HPZ97161.1 O-antigen ligase family protein [Phycisphaerae bacterium]
MPLRSIAFLLYFLGSSTGALIYPMVGLICYVILYHVYPQTTWWGKPLEPLGLRYSFICGACLLIGTALSAPRMRFGRAFLHPVEVGAIVVYLTALLTIATGVGTNAQSLLLLDKLGKIVLFLLVMSHILVTRRRLWIFVLILTLMTLYLGHEAKNAPPGAFLKNRLDGIGGPDFRESAGLAIHLCALLPFVAMVLWQKRWPLRIMAFLAAGYGVNAILLCRARSAFLACIVAGVCAVVYAPRRFRTAVVVFLLLGSLGGFFLSDAWFWKRMDTIVVTDEQQRDASSAIRLQIWAAAWEMLKSNPMGVGVGQFQFQVKKYSDHLVNTRDAHNSFILCAGECGVPGLLAYLATLGLSWVTLGQVARRVRLLEDSELYEWLIFANRLALVVYVVAGLFVSRFYTEGMWWLIMLPVCLSRAVENEIREGVQAELELASLLEVSEREPEWALAGLGRA